MKSLLYYPPADEIHLHGDADGEDVMLIFRGVRQLRIECDVPMEYLVDFHIEDVSDCQLEGIKYCVREETPGQVRFQCAEFEISCDGQASQPNFE